MLWTRGLAFLAVGVIAAVALACGGGDADAPAENSATDAPSAETSPLAGSPTATPNCSDPTDEAAEAAPKAFDSGPEQVIDPEKSYTAVIHTERGDFTMTLRADLAPQHVNSFVFLARDGYYDGVTFHRVLPGFVAQAGDPTGTGEGNPGYTLPAEFTDGFSFIEGVVGAARLPGDINSAGSQWFVTLDDASHLNGEYTVFAEVTQGIDVVQCLTARDSQTAPPGDKIIGIEIIEG